MHLATRRRQQVEGPVKEPMGCMRLLPRDTGEYVYQNVDDFDLPWLYPAPRLADPVAQGHGAGASRVIGDDEASLQAL
jgi:hypothetical protein